MPRERRFSVHPPNPQKSVEKAQSHNHYGEKRVHEVATRWTNPPSGTSFGIDCQDEQSPQLAVDTRLDHGEADKDSPSEWQGACAGNSGF